MDLTDRISETKQLFDTDLAKAKTTGRFDELYLKYFSKTKGITTLLLKELPKLDQNSKLAVGPVLNDLATSQKTAIESAKQDYLAQATSSDAIDLTVPVQPDNCGYLHPTTQVIREMNKFFRYYGYSVGDGQEIETAEYNFRRLNLPENHPATDLQDTLWIKQPELLLRTHTSSAEARILTNYKPPIRVVIPGKVYRNETTSKTNGCFFHHYQGVVVDRGITIQHLKGTLELFHKFIFGDDIELRFRYKYYPEVSPGLGTDIKCQFCGGAGCEVCKFRGWVEVLGSGMIHYNTLKMCGINPETYTGFAFGMGLDRLVMQKFHISDIRKLYGGGLVYL